MEKKAITRRDFLEKTALAAIAAAGGTSVLTAGCGRPVADFDLVIKGGTIYDGSLSAPRVTDIGVKGDRIKFIGKIDGKCTRTIDAGGLVVTPGFIDVHTHCDLTFKRLGIKRLMAHVLPSFKGNYNYLYQGVTTVVTGNCGYGYTDIDEWSGIHTSAGFGGNAYHLIPHGDLRLELFGQNQPARLDPEQLRALKSKVALEMEKGAAGFSTRLDVPPGSLASTGELIEIARVVARYGGLYATHMRDESGRRHTDGGRGVLRAIEEAIEIGREAGIAVQISHLKIDAPINDLAPSIVLELIEGARKSGLDITADQYPYPAASTDITAIVPREYLDSAGVIKKYREGNARKELKKAIDESFADLGPDKTLIVWYPDRDEYEGKTLKEIAGTSGREAAECLIDMASEKKPPVAIFFSQEIDVVRELMKPEYVFTASDGWTIPMGMMKPHPRLYGTFPRKIRRFAMEEKIVSLNQAIRSMTSLPAEKFKMKGRGRIAEGCFADIAVINLNTITDNAAYSDPHRYASGIEYVLVNGTVALEKGMATGDRGGRLVPEV